MSTITLTGDLTITIVSPFDGKLATLAEPTRLTPPPCTQEQDPRLWLGARIRSLRAERDWTQAELAGRLGMSHQTVARSEAGLRAVGIEELVALARAFDISVAELVAPLDREEKIS